MRQGSAMPQLSSIAQGRLFAGIISVACRRRRLPLAPCPLRPLAAGCLSPWRPFVQLNGPQCSHSAGADAGALDFLLS
jgi:hypothetical protein